MTEPGKRVADEFYIHLSAVGTIQDAFTRQAIECAVQGLPPQLSHVPNVAKINVRTGRLSLLSYPDFFESPFPTLAATWVFLPGTATPAWHRTYSDSLNPPILHRKELLVESTQPQREQWVALTKTAESLGLFDDVATIGFRLNWDRLIKSRGYSLVGDEFLPIGNDVAAGGRSPGWDFEGPIQRHLTALARSSLSAPVQMLVRHGLLQPGMTFFDYGCGRGGDVCALSADGVAASGWDPHYLPEATIAPADAVNLGFVINVIEDPAERIEAITKAFELARTVMSVGVMLYGGDLPGKPYRDGFLTSRNTFQKYFSQSELKDYVEHALQRNVFMVGPGVAFVFANTEAEQRFSAGRYRRKNVALRLLVTRAPRPASPQTIRKVKAREPPPPRHSRAEEKFTAARPLLDDLWTTTLELGRAPEADEVTNLAAINADLGGLPKALRLLARHYDYTLVGAAAEARSDDVRLLMAMQQFAKRPAYRQLEKRLQRDIKAFFGDYRSAQAAGLQLLLDAADPQKILAACRLAATQGLGWLDEEHSLQVHISLVERLPALLRAYVTCGLIIWDALSDVQLVKIHIASGKLTLMEFEAFDEDPLPRLRRRIKVIVRKLDCDVFEYGSSAYPKPVLYRKSRYLHEDHPGYAEQLAFDEAIERLGVLSDLEFGPTAEALTRLLDAKRLAVEGMRLGRSASIPDLDAPCGAFLTYRALIQCGDTRNRLGIANLPFNPATYNALHDLATQVLDPVIDYFGSIRLTYGFSSTELTRNIERGIAPKLDQHAACERGPRGALVCERGGAACDFLVEDEDMREVAEWIVANTPFDRLYFYGSDRAVHVSFSSTPAKQAFAMMSSPTGRLMPRPFLPSA
ncbi:DNA phosphorothioation-associated putative methyltransferase [Variovorax sp. NFACC27]|uniref:DNA phosphorothioation-associated putative methyltransferase n=1 Tax=unclassified Variovorax TaxID=663243 RepID=UPI00089D9CAD|nr:DNA phosphorothioation-associated putative methyltransferase [Variovorax sp. NFACC28]SEG69653.1 DNA phosphorothioation-associated putative methyltransferase [Variovorax sp. NFACC29]SFC84067.1 DNA phosphorothioation-associated putative methyltransferase [Variovorax sp. NFACC26]SFF97680.1 DNA phosphorothioation-associated putative methyltransferase [Variovorax sp. NFACC27]